MIITRKQLRKIIREAYNEYIFDDDMVPPLKGSRGGEKRDTRGGHAYLNTLNRGYQFPLESDIRTVYRQGRETEQGMQTHGIVDELWQIKNEPETFNIIPTKEEFVEMHAKYSPSVPKMHVEWLWNYYIVLGREL